jgi:hypothetical protein
MVISGLVNNSLVISCLVLNSLVKLQDSAIFKAI